jgi:hypothetical protein
MNTRPSSMTPEEIERILKAVETQGASIRVSDPRLSQIIAWAAIALGTLFTGAITWGVKSVSDLNTNVAILIEQRQIEKIPNGCTKTTTVLRAVSKRSSSGD